MENRPRRAWLQGLTIALVWASWSAPLGPMSAHAGCEAQPSAGKWCGQSDVPWGFGQGFGGVISGAALRIKLMTIRAFEDINYVFAKFKVPISFSGPVTSNAKILVTLGATSLGTSTCATEHTYAETYVNYSYTSGNAMASLTSANIDFNNQLTGWTDLMALNTAYHEIGHAMGIGHVYSVAPGTCPAAGSHPFAMNKLYSCTDSLTLDPLYEKAVRCLYGPDGTALTGIEFTYTIGGATRTKRSSCSGNSGCNSFTELAARGTVRYDLSISDAGGPFVLFASLDEADWTDNAFDHVFPEAHDDARVKMEVWDGATLVSAPISDPIDISAPVAVIDPGLGGVLSLTAGPNPFRESTRIMLVLDRTRRTRLWLADVAGRRVRRLADEVLEAGPHAFSWDGKDESGREAPNGVYFLVADSEGATRTLSILRVQS